MTLYQTSPNYTHTIIRDHHNNNLSLHIQYILPHVKALLTLIAVQDQETQGPELPPRHKGLTSQRVHHKVPLIRGQGSDHDRDQGPRNRVLYIQEV